MSFIDSQLARMLLADEEIKINNDDTTLNNESEKYISGYIPEERPISGSGANSVASSRPNQDQDPEFG